MYYSTEIKLVNLNPNKVLHEKNIRKKIILIKVKKYTIIEMKESQRQAKEKQTVLMKKRDIVSLQSHFSC